VNMHPLAARVISWIPGYENYFEEKDFGMFRVEPPKPEDRDWWKDEKYRESERRFNLAAKP